MVKTRLILLLTGLIINLSIKTKEIAFCDVLPSNFDEETQVYNYAKQFLYTEKILGISGKTLYNYFRSLYCKYAAHTEKEENELRIPKIIHHIWIGSPVPEELQKIMNTWSEYLPDWQHMLWTDKELDEFEMSNRNLYEASTNYGQKSDIARYEILYKFGGLYVDVDTECLRSLEDLHYLFDFYIGIQPLDSCLLHVGIGVIGSIPRHPLLRAAIDSLSVNSATNKGATHRTGPIFFTKMFYKHADIHGFRDIALPVNYFYPLASQEKVLDRDAWHAKKAFTVHHWAGTWMPKQYRKPAFRTINNDEAVLGWNT